ncbi:MAG TPA: pilus assembly protein PilM [Candidatus Omnitrophota bacterium]|nr:pilus assembly protein PilM [Candidatus Omnitrophota bacterium]HQO59182.1 pilus assembly protein PilM [Candidatus Omnitrophota bacterium]
MLHQNKENVIVSLDEAVIKIAHFREVGTEKRLLHVSKGDLRDVPEEELPQAIHAALAGIRLKKTPAVCTLPPSQVITKNIEIPSLDAEEIRSIIDLQAGRHTPFSREEILVGYIKIGVFQRNYTKILLILINRNVVKKQLEILDQAGIKVDKVLFAPEGMAHFYAQALNIKDDDIPLGIIDVSFQQTTFLIEFNKTVAMSRNIPVGLTHLLKEGDVARQRLLTELAQSVEAYQNEDINRLPETYILTSDDATLKAFQPQMQEQLKANIKIMPYLDMIQAGQPEMVKLVSEYNDDSFFSIISSGWSLAQAAVDMTPDEIKTQRAIEDKGRQIIKTGIYAVVMFILFAFIFVSKEHFNNMYLERLRADYKEKRRKVVAFDRKAQKTRIVKGYLNSRMVGLEVVMTLYKLIPDEIYLESISLDENGSVEIIGVSETMSRVFNFVTALQESDLFKNVKTRSTSAKKERGKDVAAFNIAFQLKWVAEEAEVPAEEEATEEEVPPEQ